MAIAFPFGGREMSEIEGLYRRLLDAWNRQEAAAMASCFDAEGEMIGFDGSQAKGPSEIAEHLTPIFADHETARFVGKVREVRELSPSVTLLRAAAGMVPPGGSDINPDVNTHHTLVAKRDGNEWTIALFQNTPAQFHGRPEQVDAWTEELRELL
jgi:uncharacterized protein (TIGR02246 family)